MHFLTPKIIISNLSATKVSMKLIGIIIAIFVLMFSLNFFGINNNFNDTTSIIKTTLQPLNNLHGPEKDLIIFSLIGDLSVILILYLLIYTAIIIVVSWIIKKITSLFKQQVSLISLINIFIFSTFIHNLLSLILTLILLLFSSSIKNFSENQIYLFIFLPMALINIISLAIYIYGTVITIRNKNK